MTRRTGSVRVSKELVEDLLALSSKLREVADTLEARLDKRTVKRLRAGSRKDPNKDGEKPLAAIRKKIREIGVTREDVRKEIRAMRKERSIRAH